METDGKRQRRTESAKDNGSAKGNQERERKTGARNYERGSANAKEQNLRPRKERKSASAKGSARERQREGPKKARV